jgi:hypothetical protein
VNLDDYFPIDDNDVNDFPNRDIMFPNCNTLIMNYRNLIMDSIATNKKWFCTHSPQTYHIDLANVGYYSSITSMKSKP